jgi:hypothetical protein
MHAREYTPDRAEQLVPILRSIAREIDERTRTIERLEDTIDVPSTATRRSVRSIELRGREADLAHQRRELRLAKQELGRFGCAMDEDHPLRILIPGEDGTLANGYAWNPTDESPRRSDVQHAS